MVIAMADHIILRHFHEFSDQELEFELTQFFFSGETRTDDDNPTHNKFEILNECVSFLLFL